MITHHNDETTLPTVGKSYLPLFLQYVVTNEINHSTTVMSSPRMESGMPLNQHHAPSFMSEEIGTAVEKMLTRAPYVNASLQKVVPFWRGGVSVLEQQFQNPDYPVHLGQFLGAIHHYLDPTKTYLTMSFTQQLGASRRQQIEMPADHANHTYSSNAQTRWSFTYSPKTTYQDRIRRVPGLYH